MSSRSMSPKPATCCRAAQFAVGLPARSIILAFAYLLLLVAAVLEASGDALVRVGLIVRQSEAALYSLPPVPWSYLPMAAQ